MSRIGSTDYYAADVPEGYTQIVFSSYPLSNDDTLQAAATVQVGKPSLIIRIRNRASMRTRMTMQYMARANVAMANAAATGLQKIPA